MSIFTLVSFIWLLLGVSSSSFLFLWVSLELIGVSMLSYSFKYSGFKERKVVGWKIFFSQSISSVLLLLCVSLGNNSMVQMDSYIYALFFTSMWVKLGIPPFHSWLVMMSDYMSPSFFILFNSLNKVLPIWVFTSLEMAKDMKFYSLMVLFAMVSSISALQFKNTKMFLLMGSNMNTIWIMVISSSYLMVGVMFMFIYYSLIMVINILMKKSKSYLEENVISSEMEEMWLMVLTISFLVMFSGLPPFILFFIKYYSLMGFIPIIELLTLLILWISSSILVFVYAKFLYSNFLSIKLIIKKYSKMNSLMFIIFMTVMALILTVI